MGARGALKIAHLQAVPAGEQSTTGTAADHVQRSAPVKPGAVEQDSELNEIWDRIVPELDHNGLVSTVDGPALELAFRHFLLARKAFGQVDEVTTTDKAHGDIKKHPAESVARAESEMFLKYAGQLGMTFVARARTPLKGESDGEGNPFNSPVG